jgi:hypothetical protein
MTPKPKDKFFGGRSNGRELWDDLERVKADGYCESLREIRENYSYPECQIVNSAYDLKCRESCEKPGCHYVA